METFLGDVLTVGLSSIIYDTFDGELNAFQSIIENPLLNIYARSIALDVYAKLYLDGAMSKEECRNI